MNQIELEEKVKQIFEEQVIEGLKEFIRIPNLSRDFDKDWESNGLMEQACKFVIEWIKKMELKGLKTLEMKKEAGRTCFVLVEIEGSDENSKNIFFYGHLDKQPHCLPWKEGLGPTSPVLKDGKLYGRGSSDDGYAPFAATMIMKLLQTQTHYPRVVFLLECDEETESRDLVYYMEKYKSVLGQPDMLICLDSGAATYEQMWLTTSLRGVINAYLTVNVLNEGVHSGMASGLVPTPFRILSQLLNRIEDQNTGRIIDQFQVIIPQDRQEEAKVTSELIKNQLTSFEVSNEDQKYVDDDVYELYLNNTWRSQLEVTGMDGLPPLEQAGNVLLPNLTLKLSLRTPPTLDSFKAAQELKLILEKDSPYNSHVECIINDVGNGYNVNSFPQNLKNILHDSSLKVFQKPCAYMGVGGSIPFIQMLAEIYPKCLLLVTGVGGPDTNAHGPNENIDIKFTQQLIMSLVHILNQWNKS